MGRVVLHDERVQELDDMGAGLGQADLGSLGSYELLHTVTSLHCQIPTVQRQIIQYLR